MLNMIHEYKIEAMNPWNAQTRMINVFFCANNLLLNKQTLSRFQEKFPGEKTLQFSCKSTITRYADLFTLVLDEEYNNIVCCTNHTRIDSIARLITSVSRLIADISINVWVDEVHTFFKQTLKLSELKLKNVNIYGMTATPKVPMFKAYSCSLEFFPLASVTNAEIYRGWADLRKQGMEFYDLPIATTHQFVDHVIRNNTDIIKAGTNWFVPADYTLEDHGDMKNLLVDSGFAVIVVNGGGICLTLPVSKKKKTFLKDQEFCSKLADIYKECNLDEFPVAITGNLCIGEAITIQSIDFLFDYAILSPSGNPEIDSQCGGRVKGNIKKFETYRPCKVFTTQEFDETAMRKEKLCHVLNEMAKDDKNITLDKFKDADKTEAQKFKDADKDHFIGTIDQCTELQKMFGISIRKKKKHSAPSELKKESNGENPSAEYCLSRMWGLNDRFTFYDYLTTENVSRMIAIGSEDDWIVYWKPSKFPEDLKIQIDEFKMTN